MDQERIGALIKDIRKKHNLSQSAFAKKYGVTYQAVSKWETGKNIPDLRITIRWQRQKNKRKQNFSSSNTIYNRYNNYCTRSIISNTS